MVEGRGQRGTRVADEKGDELLLTLVSSKDRQERGLFLGRLLEINVAA